VIGGTRSRDAKSATDLAARPLGGALILIGEGK